MIPGEITLLLAIKLHNGQMRWNNQEPYVSHPIRIANAAFNITKDIQIYQAALLHDVVEDTDTTLNDLRHKYNCSPRVVRMVELLTKRDKESREDYIQRLIEGNDPGVALIKILDSIDNAFINKSMEEYMLANNRDPIKQHEKYMNTAKRIYSEFTWGHTTKFHLDNLFEYMEMHRKLGFKEITYDTTLDLIRAGVNDTDCK